MQSLLGRQSSAGGEGRVHGWSAVSFSAFLSLNFGSLFFFRALHSRKKSKDWLKLAWYCGDTVCVQCDSEIVVDSAFFLFSCSGQTTSFELQYFCLLSLISLCCWWWNLSLYGSLILVFSLLVALCLDFLFRANWDFEILLLLLFFFCLANNPHHYFWAFAAYLLSKFSEAKSCKVAHNSEQFKMQKWSEVQVEEKKMNYCCSIFNFKGADKFSFFAQKDWRVGFKMNGRKKLRWFFVCALDRRRTEEHSHANAKWFDILTFFGAGTKQISRAEPTESDVLILESSFWAFLFYHNL